MLRGLTSAVLLLAATVPLGRAIAADETAYQEPTSEALAEQAGQIQRAIEQAKQLEQSDELKRLLQGERDKVRAVSTPARPGSFELPDYAQDAKARQYLDRALKGMGQVPMEAATPTPAPLILVSFSMPVAQLKALQQEADRVGAVMVIRGLVGNDFTATRAQIEAVAAGPDSAMVIDPTLFRRFQVSAVPAFVLPLEPIASCERDGCTEAPLHVKAVGSATLEYFLDLVARTGTEAEKQEALKWLAKYGS